MLLPLPTKGMRSNNITYAEKKKKGNANRRARETPGSVAADHSMSHQV
jgi:hypothetical protein